MLSNLGLGLGSLQHIAEALSLIHQKHHLISYVTMPRKAPPQPLAGGANDGAAIDKAPASAQSLRSPTSPEVPLSRWGVNRSDDNMRQTSFMAGTRPELNPRSVSNDSGTIYDAGIETSPAKTGFSKYFAKSKKKDKEDGKRPATAKDGKSRDEVATVPSDTTALDLGSDSTYFRQHTNYDSPAFSTARLLTVLIRIP